VSGSLNNHNQGKKEDSKNGSFPTKPNSDQTLKTVRSVLVDDELDASMDASLTVQSVFSSADMPEPSSPSTNASGEFEDSIQLNHQRRSATRSHRSVSKQLEEEPTPSLPPTTRLSRHSSLSGLAPAASSFSGSMALATLVEGDQSLNDSSSNWAQKMTASSSNLIDDDDDASTVVETLKRRTDNWKPQAPPVMKWSSSLSALDSVVEMPSLQQVSSSSSPVSSCGSVRSVRSVDRRSKRRWRKAESKQSSSSSSSMSLVKATVLSTKEAAASSSVGPSRGIARHHSASALQQQSENDAVHHTTKPKGGKRSGGRVRRFLNRWDPSNLDRS